MILAITPASAETHSELASGGNWPSIPKPFAWWQEAHRTANIFSPEEIFLSNLSASFSSAVSSTTSTGGCNWNELVEWASCMEQTKIKQPIISSYHSVRQCFSLYWCSTIRYIQKSFYHPPGVYRFATSKSKSHFQGWFLSNLFEQLLNYFHHKKFKNVENFVVF